MFLGFHFKKIDSNILTGTSYDINNLPVKCWVGFYVNKDTRVIYGELLSLFVCFVNAAVYDGEVFSRKLGPPILSHIVKGIFTVYYIVPIGAYIIV
jgi:hypothetical protein